MIITIIPRHSRKIWLLLVLLLMLGGCSSDMGELQAYVESVKSKPPGDIPPIPEVKTYETYTYPGHDRDPFDPNTLIGYVVEAPTPGKPAAPRAKKIPDNYIVIDTNRSKEYLEGYPLDSLSMVGTLTQKGKLWALIQTSDGTIQRVSKGNYMGQNNGKVLNVSEADIQLQEAIPYRLGGHIKRDAAIAMQELAE